MVSVVAMINANGKPEYTLYRSVVWECYGFPMYIIYILCIITPISKLEIIMDPTASILQTMELLFRSFLPGERAHLHAPSL